MIPLSVVIITRNEEKNIGRTLESVKWADQIVLVDSQSTDRTVEIAKEYGVKHITPEWEGYGHAKKSGVDAADNDWILSIDADEVLSSKLIEEINILLEGDNLADGYYMPRMTNFIGKWIKHSGWYPDYVLRLFNRKKGNFNLAVVHEAVIIDGQTERLKNDLLHYSYPDLEEYFNKFNRYTTIGAEQLFEKGRNAGFFHVAIKPPIAFIKHFIIKLGFLDGLEGFLVSFLSSVAVMVKYAKLYRLNKQSKG